MTVTVCPVTVILAVKVAFPLASAIYGALPAETLHVELIVNVLLLLPSLLPLLYTFAALTYLYVCLVPRSLVPPVSLDANV